MLIIRAVIIKDLHSQRNLDSCCHSICVSCYSLAFSLGDKEEGDFLNGNF
jgi:hypothetical protein